LLHAFDISPVMWYIIYKNKASLTKHSIRCNTKIISIKLPCSIYIYIKTCIIISENEKGIQKKMTEINWKLFPVYVSSVSMLNLRKSVISSLLKYHCRCDKYLMHKLICSCSIKNRFHNMHFQLRRH